jgi:hypothetical protein
MPWHLQYAIYLQYAIHEPIPPSVLPSYCYYIAADVSLYNCSMQYVIPIDPRPFIWPCTFNMSNPTILPHSVTTQIRQVIASIPPEHHDAPKDGGIVSNREAAIIHLNNWAFLHGYGYVSASGSAIERRWRYNCVFHSRGEKITQNSRKTSERERVRVNTQTRGIGCPVGVTIAQ